LYHDLKYDDKEYEGIVSDKIKEDFIRLIENDRSDENYDIR